MLKPEDRTIKILKPAKATPAYDIAADETAKYYKMITGKDIQIITEDDGESELIIIGSDSVNDFCSKLFLDGLFEDYKIRYGTDDFQIESFTNDGRKMLLMAGGNGRATLYAVYCYFEKFCGCRYFWDGDIIQKAKSIPLSGIFVSESPRFEYRGLRYFAHRGLHRFQAEHWGYEDWKREIDWMLKKRLNLFMLRIGDDDLFQQTFPEVVSYPENNKKLIENRHGYSDRTSAWSLKYRGELRRKIMMYANERELMSPNDCGTMTHWYTPTPVEFIDKEKPEFFAQCDNQYTDTETLVWDIRKQKNFDNYFKLTEKSAELYGNSSIFHTIGFAERTYSNDRKINMNMKLYIYKKIAEYLYEHHKDAKLFIASWDIWMFYTDEEMQRLISILNPEQAIIFDYTSDTMRKRNFTTWGVVGKFPYIFGIFHGYCSNTDIRGNYDLTEERLKIAAYDNFCKGMIFWPEVSHTDTFMTEYFTQNAWSPLRISLNDRIRQYCKDRYLDNDKAMQKIWNSFMPIVMLMSWSMDETIYNTKEWFLYPTSMLDAIASKKDCVIGFDCKKAELLIDNACLILNGLTEMITNINDRFLCRDAFDIARTVIGRYVHFALVKVCVSFLNCRKKQLHEFEQVATALFKQLWLLLGEHNDYSIYTSFKRLSEESTVNTVFEETLKDNSSCGYNRTYAYETMKELSYPELAYLFELLNDSNDGKIADRLIYEQKKDQNFRRYMNTPLKELGTHKTENVKIILNAASCELAKLKLLTES